MEQATATTSTAGDTAAQLSFVPPLQRRRLSPLARALFHTVYEVRIPRASAPMVLSSHYGDSRRTYRLLQAVAGGEELSPTDFSLSVHNAIAGQLSIILGETAPVISLAPGEGGMTAALLEAAGMLAAGSGYNEVLVAWYDGPLPEFYRPYADSPESETAIAVRLSLPAGGARLLQVGRRSAPDNAAADPLAAVAGLLAGDSDCIVVGERGHGWEWRLQ